MDTVSRELEKNQMDKIVSEVELENAKHKIAQELMTYQYDISDFNVPRKIKKPLLTRLKQKIKRLFDTVY